MNTTKPSTRRQLVADARQSSLEGRWEEAIELNQQLIERTPKDAEAHNRLGRAYLALGRLTEAGEAYSNALRADPANLIARRNLQRLESLRRRDADMPWDDGGSSAVTTRTAVFIEEVGKTWVDELVNAVPTEELADVFPGEQVALVVEGNRLIVTRNDGRRLGEVEAKTAERMIRLMAGGNRYEAYALGISGQSLRVILREVFRDPSQAGEVSFPRQITSRAYLRERDLLRARDEADFFLLEEDEDDEDDALTTEADDDEPVEPDNEGFIEETGQLGEEDENAM